MRESEHPSLPGWIEDIYNPIEQYLRQDTNQESVTRQQAVQLIVDAKSNLASSDIDHALDYLLNRGWLYEVDDQLFVTEFQDPKSVESNS